MFKHLRNALNGTNGAFYDRFRIAHQRLLSRLDSLPPATNPSVSYFLTQMRDYLGATLAVLHTLFLGYNNFGPIFGKADLTGVSPANGERLFSLLLVAMIRQSTASDHEEGDAFCDLATMIIPEEVIPAAKRLSTAMRTSDLNECERKMSGMFEQVFRRLDPIVWIGISGVVLHLCAGLNIEKRSQIAVLNSGAAN